MYAPEHFAINFAEAARTYYHSLRECEKMIKSGKYRVKVSRQRKRSCLRRISIAYKFTISWHLLYMFAHNHTKVNKEEEHLFKLQTMCQESKNKWGECLKMEFMSSEDSGKEGKQSAAFVTRSHLWECRVREFCYLSLLLSSSKRPSAIVW